VRVTVALSLAVIAFSVAAAIGVMLVVRRFAPPGGFFADTERAGAVFAVMGTAFAVLLAFVIFLAFASYDRARDKASLEAVAVSQLFRTAKIFSPAAERKLRGELICYARSVVHDEWPAMRHGRTSPSVDAWLARIEGTIDVLPIRGENQRVAYEHWFDQAAEQREGRRGRLAEASPFVPSLVWLALVLGGSLLIAYVWFYADPGESPIVQAMMAGSVTAIVIAGMLVVRFLERPYSDGGGSVRPVAMELSVRNMEAASRASRLHAATLCDQRGQPVGRVRAGIAGRAP